MKWSTINDLDQITTIVNASNERPQVIFKHSTTCPISSMAKMRLEESWDFEDVDAHYLDLLAYRPISTAIADDLQVHHESPQLILLMQGEVIFDSSHLDINVEEVKESIAYVRSKA
jgi:bacillithiol system protein YtxJ